MARPSRPPPGLPDRDTLARFIADAGETDVAEIARHFGLKGSDRRALRQMLKGMQGEGALGKPGQLPVNATGAIGALGCELGLPWRLCRGLAVIGRTVGIVGHLAHELRNPLAREIWERTEAESSAHTHPSPDTTDPRRA